MRSASVATRHGVTVIVILPTPPSSEVTESVVVPAWTPVTVNAKACGAGVEADVGVGVGLAQTKGRGSVSARALVSRLGPRSASSTVPGGRGHGHDRERGIGKHQLKRATVHGLAATDRHGLTDGDTTADGEHMTGAGVGTVITIFTELPDVDDGEGDGVGEGLAEGLDVGDGVGGVCVGTLVGEMDGAGVGCAIVCGIMYSAK